MFAFRTAFRLPVILAVVVLALPAGFPARAAGAEGDTAQRVLDTLQAERRQAGAELLVRRDDLDVVAQARARRVAGLPHDKRLALGESIQAGLSDAGIKGFRHASVHLDMVRGYSDPAAGFLRSWRGYSSAWTTALDPRQDSIGLATYTAADGWIVLVAVMLDELPIHDDLRDLEERTIGAVNEVRRESGLGELVESALLTRIARDHSEDMARRLYFGHRSPDGMLAKDRVRAGGLRFRALAENIQRNQGWDDPVRQAVDSWMASPGHREAILETRFVETGVGVTKDEEGRFYFTQLYLTRDVAAVSSSEEPRAE